MLVIPSHPWHDQKTMHVATLPPFSGDRQVNIAATNDNQSVGWWSLQAQEPYLTYIPYVWIGNWYKDSLTV